MIRSIGWLAGVTAVAALLAGDTLAQTQEPREPRGGDKAPGLERQRPGTPQETPAPSPKSREKSDQSKPGDRQAGPSPGDKTVPGKDAEKDAATDAADATDPKSQARPPRLPQTAEEKAKRLADLYAQLATADDEDVAKRHAGAIERLWRHSGSDTVALLLDRAAKAAKDNNNELAQKLYDHVVSLAPDFTEGFNQRAYFHFKQSNYDAAVGDLRRVIALDPSHYKALEGLAQIWRETGNKKGAYGVMKQLMDIYPLAPGAKAIYDELKRETDGQGI